VRFFGAFQSAVAWSEFEAFPQTTPNECIMKSTRRLEQHTEFVKTLHGLAADYAHLVAAAMDKSESGKRELRQLLQGADLIVAYAALDAVGLMGAYKDAETGAVGV
jgi:hypothetical protein